MKKILTLCFALIAVSGFSQSLKATYTVTAGSVSPRGSAKKPLPSIFTYEYSKGKSLLTKITDPDLYPDLKRLPENIFYKDLKRGLFRWEVTFGINTYSIKDKLDVFDWKISSETENINGYLCTKATCIINAMMVTAWFCPTINISDGPLMYNGLPGFIIRLTNGDNNDMIASDIKIIKKSFQIKEPVPQNNVINMRDFKRLTRTTLTQP
jgi:GLPGLI family protein